MSGARGTRSAPEHSAARTLAAVLGAPLTAAISCSAICSFAPLPESWRVALGIHLLLPSWLLLACCLPLVSSGRRAWALCAAVCLPLAAALLLRSLP